MIILSPKPAPPSPIVVTAWRVQLMVDAAADPRLARFLDRFQVGSGGAGEPLRRPQN